MIDDLRDKAMAAVKAAAPIAAEDATRPVYHFCPPAGWMNDVHGAFYHEGQHHIFFQFHPWSGDMGTDNRGEGIGWGHARSPDLVRWEFLPPALLPLKEKNERLIASGSAYIRSDKVPMLFFTHTPYGMPQNKREAWGALPVDDDLIAWRRVDIGLQPGKSGVPADIKANWADMFVFRVGHRVFATFKESNGLICEAHNEQLTSWQAIGNLGGGSGDANANEPGVGGECPNLFSLEGRQVLIRSTYPISYLIGEFDPDAVTLRVDAGPHVLDYAHGGTRMPTWFSRGVYGTTVFTDPTDRTILVGWVGSYVPDRAWNSHMCLPRVLTMDGDRLIQTPIAELSKLRGKHTHIEKLHIQNESKCIDGVEGDTLEIVAEFDVKDAASFGLMVRSNEEATDGLPIIFTDGILNVAGTEVLLELMGRPKTLKLHLFLDKSALELFIQNGSASVTRVDYPPEQNLSVFAFAEGGSVTLRFLDAWIMKSAKDVIN